MTEEILLGAVTSRKHEEMLDRWLDGVNNLTSPHHLVMVDTTIGSDSYAKKLEKKGVDVIKYKWDSKEKHWYQAMADCKNLLRDRVLENGYTHFFSLDTDEFIPSDALRRLIEHDKDNVGYPTPMWHEFPAVFKSGGYVPTGKGSFKLDIYTWKELIDRMEKEKSYLLKVHSVGNGCLLSKKKILKKIEWAVPDFPPIAPDTIWYINVGKQGFETYVDMSTIPLHLPKGSAKASIEISQQDILGKNMIIAHGYITDDDPKEREIEYYGPK